GAGRQCMHRRRPRRSRPCRLCHSRGNPPCMAGSEAARRRSGPPRRHIDRDDGGGRGMVQAPAGTLAMTRKTKEIRLLRTRVKKKSGLKASSRRWLERHLNDPYVVRARAEGYRSRAAFKLLEIDER